MFFQKNQISTLTTSHSRTDNPWDPTSGHQWPKAFPTMDHRWTTDARRHFSPWTSMDYRCPSMEMKISKTAYVPKKTRVPRNICIHRHHQWKTEASSKNLAKKRKPKTSKQKKIRCVRNQPS